MKKTVVLMIFSVMFFSACNLKKNPDNLISDANKVFESIASTSSASTEAESKSVGDLKTVAGAINNIVGPGIDISTKEVNIVDANELKSFTGLDSGEKINEALVSEATKDSQSLIIVFVRLKDENDLKDVAQELKNGTSQSKWKDIQKEVKVAGSQDVVMLVIASSRNSGKLAEQTVDAFEKVCGNVIIYE